MSLLLAEFLLFCFNFSTVAQMWVGDNDSFFAYVISIQLEDMMP